MAEDVGAGRDRPAGTDAAAAAPGEETSPSTAGDPLEVGSAAEPQPAASARETPPARRRTVARTSSPAERPPDLRLATLHLRSGMLGLARAELETAAGNDALDEAGLLDLAEVRWRSGDMRGAATAASAWLDLSPASRSPLQEGLAHVVLAEAAASRGREDEVADQAAAALGALGTAASGGPGGRRGGRTVEALLDGLFAGQLPRAAAWPLVPRDDGRQGAAGGRGPSRGRGAKARPAMRPALTADETVEAPNAAVAADAGGETPSGSREDARAPITPSGALPVEMGARREPATPGVDAGATLVQAVAERDADPDHAAILFLLALHGGADPDAVLAGVGEDDGRPALALVRAEALAAAGRREASSEALAAAGLTGPTSSEPEPGASTDAADGGGDGEGSGAGT